MIYTVVSGAIVYGVHFRSHSCTERRSDFVLVVSAVTTTGRESVYRGVIFVIRAHDTRVAAIAIAGLP